MRLLWHLEIFWWGRIGKALELAGGMTVIATIVGAERLEKIAEALRDNAVRRIAKRLRSKVPTLWQGYRDSMNGTAVQSVSAFIPTVAVVFFVALGFFNHATSGDRLFGGTLAGIANVAALTAAGGLFVAPALGLVVVLLLVGAGYALDFVIARPLAFGIRTATRESVVQGVGLLFLAVGIQFDLLSV